MCLILFQKTNSILATQQTNKKQKQSTSNIIIQHQTTPKKLNHNTKKIANK